MMVSALLIEAGWNGPCWKVSFGSRAWSDSTHCMMISKGFASSNQHREAGRCLKATKGFGEGTTSGSG